MIPIGDIEERIKLCIVKALELDILPEDIGDDAPLFGEGDDSLNLDSLAALEIVVALGREFGLVVTDVKPEVFETIGTLAAYVSDELAAGAGTGQV